MGHLELTQAKKFKISLLRNFIARGQKKFFFGGFRPCSFRWANKNGGSEFCPKFLIEIRHFCEKRRKRKKTKMLAGTSSRPSPGESESEKKRKCVPGAARRPVFRVPSSAVPPAAPSAHVLACLCAVNLRATVVQLLLQVPPT